MLVLVSLFVAAALAQYDITYSYSDTNCQNLVGFHASKSGLSASCIENTTCDCSRGVCGRVECNASSLPPPPPDLVINAAFNSSDCTGELLYYYAATNGVCFNTAGGQTFRLYCSDANYSYAGWIGGNCTGAPSTEFPGAGMTLPLGPTKFLCTEITGSSSRLDQCGLPDPKCFHEDSVVTVAGKQMTYQDFLAPDAPCHIPHEFHSAGVKISTTCTGVLRVTAEHLVMTPEGFRTAGSLVKGDRLYSQIHSDTADCTVTSVESEVFGNYFGLNCEDGHVEADGYWVSTFGIHHTIPNVWMKVVSKLIGVKYASQVGDAIATMLHRLGVY